MTRPTRAIRPVSGLVLLAVTVLVAGCGGGGSKSSNTGKSPTTTGSKYAAPTKTGTTTTTTKSKTRTGPHPAPSASSKKLARGALVVRTRSATTNLYPVLGGSLTSYAPGQVEGNAVEVLSVVGPQAFWVGKGPNQRLLVHIRLKGEKPPTNLAASKKVHIIGQLTKNRSAATNTFGVKDSADKALLDKQGAYAEVSIGDLQIG